jgi:NodT family efflux transporter outer membrane factor (OMF) lipoprotein
MTFGDIRIVFVVLAGLFGGCAVGPDYAPPELEVPDAWRQQAMQGLSEGEADLQTWWNVFNDPVLNRLIEQAGRGNLDLQIAMARIRQSRALRGIATGEYFPDVDGTGFYSRSRPSENGLSPPPLGTSPDQTNLHGFGLDSSWEIDVFGRISRSVEAADASLQGSIEDYRDVLVSLYAEIALTYVDIRTFQERITYAESNAQTQRDTLQLTKDRNEAELVPELDVRQAEFNLASTESSIPQLKKFLARAEHRLAVLLGQYPAELAGELSARSSVPHIPESVAVGLAADLIRQRPDLRRAERDLAAQTARIGVATADLYPRFSLSGTFALEGTQLKHLGNMDSRDWAFGPSFRWNLFDGDRVRNNVAFEEALAEESLVRYEQTLLGAVEEVENALVGYSTEMQRQDFLAQSVQAAEKSVELVQTLYRSGLTDFQNVLDSERSLFLAHDDYAASRGVMVQELIGLYKALGGGWQLEDDELSIQ